MNQQLDLMTIRRQPLQPEARIPARVIKAYVKENMRGFSRRQALRERTREERRKRESPRKPRAKQEHSFVKTIPITYRAIFEQPTGPLNPIGAKIPGPQPIEVFRKAGFWYARELSTSKRNVFVRLGNWSNHAAALRGVEESFVRRLQSWQVWGTPPDSPVECPLTPDQFEDLGDGKAGWYESRDRTHIMHKSDGSRKPPAACGATDTGNFISNRANVEPSCKECAKVWKEHYKK